jgi:PAS domain S-box-containing protein
VDDTPGNLVALEAVLSDDFELFCAKSGPEALALLAARQDIDVILLDVVMPVMDGYEVARRIKKLAGCEEIPIVFITAVYTEDPNIKRGYAAGAVDYFTKPFDPDILKLKVSVYASFRQRSAILRERELQVRESEEVLRAGRKLTSILEGLPVGVIITDVEGRIDQLNEEVLRILGMACGVDGNAYGEMLGWWDDDGNVLKGNRAPLACALEDGLPTHHAPVEIRCADGKTKNLIQSTSPLRDLDGAIVGAVVALQDITEHRRFEADFEYRIAKLTSLGVGQEQSATLNLDVPSASNASDARVFR